MDTHLILIVAFALVGCGCLGLLLVRITNDFLDGLGWLSASYACGTLAALILTFDGRIPLFWGNIVSNGLTLFAFVCIHNAALELIDSKVRCSRFSILLMGIWLPFAVFFTYIQRSDQMFLIAIDLCFTVQAGQTLLVLLRHRVRQLRVPIWYSSFVLFVFAGFNLFRVGFLWTHGSFHDNYETRPSPLQFVATFVYLAAALGVGFGFFWTTTAKLRITLDRFASTDSLTGVANRRVFREACEKEMTRSRRTRQGFSLLVCDIDHFKQVNDRFGHMAGDLVLCALAERIQQQLRPGDALGRWGGEEFVVLLAGCSPHQAFEIAERLREAVASLAVATEPDQVIRVTMSLGLTGLRTDGDALDDIFRRGDAALYRAKAAGRNRVEEQA